MFGRARIWARLFLLEPFRGVLRHKLRSTLSVLGITIGIASVVLVVAIGTAGSAAAEKQLHDLGDNLVWVEAGARNIAGVRTGTKAATTLTYDDAEAILKEVPLIRAVSPQIDGSVQVVYGNKNWNTRYRGITPDYLSIKRWIVVSGAAFTMEQSEDSERVCLIGETLRQQLFGDLSGVGEVIRVNGYAFTVLGVLGRKGQSATGQDQDDTLMLPYSTALRKLKGKGITWLDDILCSAASPETVGAAADAITELLRQRHGIREGSEDDFNIRRPDELIKANIEASDALATLLTSVAAISLLVGGIGIMNVMLASVVQRTREIGLRLAVGAKDWMVQLQFLGEAVVLTLFGGAFGVGLSVSGSGLVGEWIGWPIAIPPNALALALGSSIGAGIFFGFYPAWRASRLDPIEALRHE